MAEVAGLVVGVLGIAGLIGAFKDAIDLFNKFTDSRELGRDYEILDTKIDIEKTILLQWADHVNLLRFDDYDSRLDEPNTQLAVARILECIHLLMNDESKLKRVYGLGEAKGQQKVAEKDPAPTISGPRMEKFMQEFENLDLKVNSHNQRISLRQRARWVIRDKQKFEKLVEELSHFNTKLNQVMPIYHDRAFTQSMTDKDISGIQDLRELKIILDASTGHRNAIAQSTQRYIIQTCQD
jgi:hypothetical protein